MEIAKFRASLSLPFRFRCNPLRPRCCVCNVYTFLKNFVYHPTYQAERMQKRTFYFSPAALHLLQNCLDLASMPYNGGSCDIVWRRTDRLLRFLRVVIFRKTFWWSFQLDQSVAFLDSQSATTFIFVGRYSAVTSIWWDIR